MGSKGEIMPPPVMKQIEEFREIQREHDADAEYLRIHTPAAQNVRTSTPEYKASGEANECGKFFMNKPKRRLAASSVISNHDAPSDWLLAPLLFILMLVLFMYRKPIQEFLSGSNSVKTSYGGLRKIQKKPPVRHF